MATFSHPDYERLERSVTMGRRISIFRRGTEFLVIPISIETRNGREIINARHPTTGDTLSLYVDEIDAFEVIG
jgi:hypothetical protein